MIINTNVVLKVGSIIGMYSLIYHDVVTGEFCNINTGAITKANCRMNSYTKIDVREVYLEKPFNKEYSFEVGV